MKKNKTGESPHLPVLYHESLKYLQPKPGGCYVDGTVGAGGHASGILAACAPDGKLLGLDIDTYAISIAKKRLYEYGSRCTIQKGSYANIREYLCEHGWDSVNGILLDLGISSMQIDTAEKGFSFLKDAPLDMRFDQQSGATAANLLNTLSENEIADLIWKFGEENKSRQIARLIVENRPMISTTQLAEVVRRAYKGQRGKAHPATRTFQALRIAVNNELKILEEGLRNSLDALAPEGRIAVITFHSLEDRKVKQFFHTESMDCICPPEQIICNCGHKASIELVVKKPIRSSQEEIEKNPRARSAKLRVAQKK